MDTLRKEQIPMETADAKVVLKKCYRHSIYMSRHKAFFKCLCSFPLPIDANCQNTRSALESTCKLAYPLLHIRKPIIAWRDGLEKKIGRIRSNQHMVTVSNATTGVVGVRINEKLNRYEVTWVTQQGKQGKTSVSIKKSWQNDSF